MAKKTDGAPASRSYETSQQSDSTLAVDVAPLIDKLVDVLSALKETDAQGKLFPRGIETLHLKVTVGGNSVDLNIGGPVGFFRGTDARAADFVSADAGVAILPITAFDLLPQVSGNGYYSYSPAPNQFGTKNTVNAVVDVGKQWQNNGQPPFGVGDISLQQGGPMPGHTTGHQQGRNVDVRPMRTDGQQKPVTWQDPAYSRQLTQLLVDNFRAHANCTKIFFNDPNINGVQPLAGHDNHLHVEMAT